MYIWIFYSNIANYRWMFIVIYMVVKICQRIIQLLINKQMIIDDSQSISKQASDHPVLEKILAHQVTIGFKVPSSSKFNLG